MISSLVILRSEDDTGLVGKHLQVDPFQFLED
jgi:hypothetical protein